MINYYQAVPRTDQTKTVAVYVYDGTNAQEAIDFIDKFRANPDRVTKPIYRPKEYPNLPSKEFREWWYSTGEEKVRDDYCHTKYNTHNDNNLPPWEKDEDFYVTIPSTDYAARAAGLCERIFMKKGDALYFANGHVDYCPHFVSIDELLDDLDLVLVKK